ncbi:MULTISPECIES: M23 family metallopeptidase [Hydrogenibacillus]|uniref:M23 family metallopeptidase n=1 Tax=Hydrogenibacillus TaxID=1609627 RepID=UPI001C7CCF18|nr:MULTISPECIES: M23 family metallopeptidase [Hydrogenibacillus]QZA32971.1 peptidoglycan DD-metalloendopeptidase family protein [Hydrogenibacillus sp. N12]
MRAVTDVPMDAVVERPAAAGYPVRPAPPKGAAPSARPAPASPGPDAPAKPAAVAANVRYRHLAARFPVVPAGRPEPRRQEAAPTYGPPVHPTGARRPAAGIPAPPGDGAALSAGEASREAAALPANDAPAVAGPVPFLWPVEAPRVTSPFGPRWGRFHYGVDLVSARGDRIIRAARSGIVRLSGRLAGGYGNLIILAHGDGLETTYAHLARRFVREGELVRAGEPIGLMGAEGHATGIHLHFEIRQNDRPLDPLPLLRSAGWAGTGAARPSGG